MQTFENCFSKGYWKQAVGEVKKLKSLIVCALFIALRVAVKSLRITLAPGLNITFDYIVNAIGSMVYGPILALIGGAVSDTIGAILIPSGIYFFPYIFVEMLSGFIFALFLYNQKLTGWRIVLSRFCVVILCNIVLNPIIMHYDPQYQFKIFSVARIIKNTAMFPFDSVILLGILPAVNYALSRIGYVNYQGKMEITNKDILFVIILSVIAVAFVTFGLLYSYKIIVL